MSAISASHFEAKKHAYRQTQDGIVVSFVVHPNDVTPSLAMAALGTRFMVALAEINDDETPSGGDEQPAASQASPLPTVSPRAVEDSGHTKKPLSLSSQCALRCKDKRFQEWFKETYRVAFATGDGCANAVRMVIGIASRAELDSRTDHGNHWRLIDSKYQQYLTTLQHGALAR